jgi:hypothetical protein
MVDHAVSAIADYMEKGGVNKDEELNTQNLRRWIISHEYVAPITHRTRRGLQS